MPMQIPVISKLFAKTTSSTMPGIPPSVSTQPMRREVAWASPSFFQLYGGKFETYNPDQLVAKKGAGIYRKMLHDPQVKAAYNLVVDIMVSRSFRFDKPDDSLLQQEIAEFFDFQVHEFIKGTWLQAMRAILLAKAHGFSVSEKIYQVGEWEGKPKWMVRAIKSRPFESFTFKHDVYGNVSKLIQDQDNARKTMDPKKFIVFLSYPELDPIYGESDLRACYRSYWEKDVIIKFRNIYLERTAGGHWVANPTESGGVLSAAEESDFRDMLNNVTVTTAMIIPKGYEAELKHGFNTDAYEKAIQDCDKQIAKALLVPNLLGFSEQGQVGALAQSKTQLKTFFKAITRQGVDLADTLNEQFFAELAWWNYGVKQFPRFTFEDLTDEEKVEIAEKWMLAVEKGVVSNTDEDEKRTRELLQYKLRESDEEGEPGPNPPPEEEPKEEELSEKRLPQYFQEQITSWQARTNFAEIESNLDEDESAFFIELALAIDMTYDEIKRRMKIVHSQLPNKDDINIKKEFRKLEDAVSKETKTQMRETIRVYLRQAYRQGRKAAQKELNEAAKNLSELHQDHLAIAIDSAQRKAIDPESKLGYASFDQGLGVKTADKVFAEKAFKITGDLTEEMVSKAKQVLLNGIRDELSVDDMIEQLLEVLPTLVGKIDESTGLPDPLERSRLETIVRTNVLDAFNQARLSVFSDPDLDNFVEAMQYSAILDSRTTEFCKRYDGRVFRLNDPVWKSITPPNHFRCRSVMIAVTVVDEWSESEKAKGDDGSLIQPGAGFGKIKG